MTCLKHRHVAIIGAGIVGVQLARALQRHGCRVTVFDPCEPGTGTSFGNAGFIATDEIFPLAHGRVLRALPRMLLNPLGPLTLRWRETPRLLPWYLRYARACSSARSAGSVRALAALQGYAADAWRRTARRDHLGTLLREAGAWKLFESDRGLAATAAERAVQREYGIAWTLCARAPLHEQIPELGPTVRHGVFYPGGMSVANPLAVTTALFARFVQDGGHYTNATATLAMPAGGRGGRVALHGADGAVDCDAIVVAAGHRSGRLLEPLGLRVPIVAERGYHVEMSHDELSFDMPMGLHERGFYLTPMTSGLRLAGTSEFSSADHDEPPNWARAEILKRHIVDILPGVARQETGRWMGHRPTLPDFLPALGTAPGFDNLFVAFGHHHLGLTLSAITAEQLGAHIATGASTIDLAPFSLARFQ